MNPTMARGSLAFDVPCPHCKAAEGAPCTTPSRTRRAGDEHRARWDALHVAYRRPYRYTLVADDPRFRLATGDVIVCVPYQFDPAKLTVLYREADGFDPECNVYVGQVKRIRGSAGKARVEWNPIDGVWKPATLLRASGVHYWIQVDDNRQMLTVEARHTRPFIPAVA